MSKIIPVPLFDFVIFGATGDLTLRKLLPALFHRFRDGQIPPDSRIIGVARSGLDSAAYRSRAADALRRHVSATVLDGPAEAAFLGIVHYVSLDAAAPGGDWSALQALLRPDRVRVFYLATSPDLYGGVCQALTAAGLATGEARVVLEKPIGHDLASARAINDEVGRHFPEARTFRIDHFLGKEAAQNILAFRFANGLFEPIWNRNHIQHVQIDVPEVLSLEQRVGFYEQTGAYRDMVVTHLFQVLAFMAMEPPTALEPRAISEEKNKVFRSMRMIEPSHVVRGQYLGYRDEPGVAADSDTETFIAPKAEIDNWRWAGVPFFLRTGKRMAEGARIISIAFHEPPKSMFPPNSGVGQHGPDHLTFDLADASKLSLSFYGKRPGPGMKLDKLSLQFALHETGRQTDVLEAYERLIHDAMSGDHTLFTTSEGIERLWELSTSLIDSPSPVRSSRQARGDRTPSIS